MFVAMGLLICVSTTVGCGTNIEELLFQSVSAGGRTYLDLLLTDFINDALDATQETEDPDEADDETPDENDVDAPDDFADDDDPDLVPDGGGDELVGDASVGETIFVTNGCGSCHCNDASGGCALSAPALLGVAVEVLDDNLLGDDAHPVKLDLSDQDLADLQAYFAGL